MQDVLHAYTNLLFSVFLGKALEIPPGHAMQQRLIDLLFEITKQPDPAGEEDPYWCNLPSFMGQWGEMFNTQDIERPTLLHHQLDSIEWRNMHGFLAAWLSALADKGKDGASFRYFFTALIMLRKILEVPRSLGSLNHNIPATAAYIIIAGKRLKEYCRRNQSLLFNDKTIRDRGDEIFYNGPDNWNGDRWDCWAMRFQQCAADEKLNDLTRQWAQDAYHVMQQEDT
ncbi:hypothetical protein F5B20DRAFT_561569 [Whalleya microplaca]|nr:hypothetical protein F5B20DRAFT_561569 [Whalleya microplaca]